MGVPSLNDLAVDGTKNTNKQIFYKLIASLTISYAYYRHLLSSLTENWIQRQYLQVTHIQHVQSVFNTPMMVFKDHS